MKMIPNSAGRGNAARDFFALPVLGGFALVTLMGLVRAIAPQFLYGSNMLERPIILFVVLMMLAGAVYLSVVIAVLRKRGPSTGIAWMLLVGLIMRLAMLGSNPILEDDFYRYLWDGGVAAHGHNPYAWIPKDVLDSDTRVPENLVSLGEASGQVLRRVNHPELGTVYPPVVAGVFAVAHVLAPWSTAGLKLLYLCIDLATLGLIFSLLQRLNKPGMYALIYWWNPLLVKETYNSVHMDVIILPFVLGAILFALDRRVCRAVVLIAGGLAAKIWPILLAPLVLWPARRRPFQMVGATVLLVALSAVLLLPLVPAQSHGADSGFVAYGQRWEMNDALFMVFPWATKHFAQTFGWDIGAEGAHRAGRMIAAALVLLATFGAMLHVGRKRGAVLLLPLYRGQDNGAKRGLTQASESSSETRLSPFLRALTRRPRFFVRSRRKMEDLSERLPGAVLFVVAVLFLVSPTQFPWYVAWMLPLLALQPRVSLLMLTVMMPMYYLRFYCAAHDNVDFFHHRIVWVEYAPVWIALAVETRIFGTRFSRIA